MSDTGGFVVKEAMALALNIESMQLNTGVLKLYPLPIPVGHERNCQQWWSYEDMGESD